MTKPLERQMDDRREERARWRQYACAMVASGGIVGGFEDHAASVGQYADALVAEERKRFDKENPLP